MGTELCSSRERWEESRLVGRCREGDPDAWDELFDRHYAATARFVAQVSPDLTPEDVEEVCQEVFLAVVRHLPSFQGGSRLQTWIFRIAINKAHDCRQRHLAAKRGSGRRPLSLHEPDPETGLTLDPADTRPGPDLALLRSEHWGLVGRAVAQLSARYREVVELRYFADLSYEEIARALGLNPKTVSSRLSKSLDRLERILQALLAEQTQPERFVGAGSPCTGNKRVNHGRSAAIRDGIARTFPDNPASFGL